MQRRKQSVVTLSFENERVVTQQSFSQTEPRTPRAGEAASPDVGKGEEISKRLMALCNEIGGALLSHHAAGRDLRVAREQIAKGLMQTMSCKRTQAEKLIELSKELIHARAYGKYRRNPLELSLLIQAAMGQMPVDTAKN